MNELEIRKIAKEEFMNNVMDNIDSTLIFTYIRNLERKVNHLQSKIDKSIDYINMHIRIDDEYPAYMEMRIEERDELLNILKEDK